MLDSNLRPLVHKAQNLPPSSTKALPLRHRCVYLPHKKPACWIRTCDLSFTRHRTVHQAQQKPFHYAIFAYAFHIKKRYAGFEPATSRSQGTEPWYRNFHKAHAYHYANVLILLLINVLILLLFNVLILLLLTY